MMSLLKWKELAKRKSELGIKINYAHYTITQSDIDKQTTRESFIKVFQPITTKLDDIVASNLKILKGKKRQQKKGKISEGFDYAPEVDP